MANQIPGIALYNDPVLFSCRFGLKTKEPNIDSKRGNNNKHKTKQTKRKGSPHPYPQRTKQELPPKRHLSSLANSASEELNYRSQIWTY